MEPVKDHGKYMQIKSNAVKKELHSTVINVLAVAVSLGIIVGFLDGLFDLVSNKVVFDHPVDGYGLSFSQGIACLVYSTTLTGVLYGALGLVLGLALLLYTVLSGRRISVSGLLLISSCFFFSFITLKTVFILFKYLVSGSLQYQILTLGVALLVSLLLGVLIYKLSYGGRMSESPGEINSALPGVVIIILSLLFWCGVSLPAKMFLDEESGVLASVAILAAGIVLILIFYRIISGMFAHDAFKGWQNSRLLGSKGILLLIVFTILSCAFIYRENSSQGSTYSYANSHPAQGNKDKPNVVLVLIDTLRADHLSSYDYVRKTSPNIDAMAGNGVLFKNAVSHAAWTKPSTASLFTSLYPSMHGAIFGESVLPDSVTTLAEQMKKSGYVTAGFVANPQIKAIFNFDQGFGFYDDSIVGDKVYHNVLRSDDLEKQFVRRFFNLRLNWTDSNNAEMLNKRFTPWLMANKHTNFFLYLHYIDPHAPYSPPDPFDSRYVASNMQENEKNIALYDGEIAYIDKFIGNLLESLSDLGIADKTLVVLTSDHGEEFLDHGGTGHGQSLYEEQINVPLIMTYPPSLPAGRIIEDRVGVIDIMPTILEISGISSEGHTEGVSLLPLIEEKVVTDTDGERYIFSENYLTRFRGKAVTRGNQKYIFTESSELRDVNRLGHEELYDLENDPGESNDLIAKRPETAKSFRKRLSFFTRYVRKNAVAQPATATVDQRTKEQLKALGYVD